MKKTIFLFMLCIGGAILSANAQTYMNIYHTGGINSYDTDLIPTVTFNTTDVTVNGVNAPYAMGTVSKITFGATDLTTGINEELLLSSVAVYPNPTFGVITLNIADNANGSVVNIYNVAGSLISSTTYKGTVVNEKIDLSSYDNGIYMMIINSDNTVITKKIVKN